MLSIILYKFPDGIRDILFIQFVPPSFGLKANLRNVLENIWYLREKQLYLKCENGKRRKKQVLSSSLEIGRRTGRSSLTTKIITKKPLNHPTSQLKRKNEENRPDGCLLSVAMPALKGLGKDSFLKFFYICFGSLSLLIGKHSSSLIGKHYLLKSK